LEKDGFVVEIPMYIDSSTDVYLTGVENYDEKYRAKKG
jgi:hypothetical protein